jgi:hypothetical protein
MRDLQEFFIKIAASLATRFTGHYSTLSRLLLEYVKGQDEEENQTKTRAPEAADAAATEFGP